MISKNTLAQIQHLSRFVPEDLADEYLKIVCDCIRGNRFADDDAVAAADRFARHRLGIPSSPILKAKKQAENRKLWEAAKKRHSERSYV